MNKKTIYIIVAVLVVVIIIAGAAAYILSNNGNGGTTSPTPTPAPTPTMSVAGATTLTFSANVTSQGQTTEYKWAGKDIHANMTLRVDFANYAYILDAGQRKSWVSTDSGATWTTSTFATDWGTVAATGFGNQWSDYVSQLASWSGSGDYSYANTVGEAIVLFNISVNPTIPASTFATS